MGVVASNERRTPRHWALFRRRARPFALKHVLDARKRFAEVYAESGSFLIGRRQYFEVFTDYDLENVHQGQFLSLALEIFSVFEQEHTGIADIREIFCLLALIAHKSPLSARLEAVFPLFGPAMTEERVSQFLVTVQRGLHRTGLLEERSSANWVLGLAGRICGEGSWRRCQTVSAQLLGDWLTNCPELREVVAAMMHDSEAKLNEITFLRDKEDLRASGSIMKREAKKLLASSQSAPSLRNNGANKSKDRKNRRDKGGQGQGERKNKAGKRTESVSVVAASIESGNAPPTFDQALCSLDAGAIQVLQESWNKSKVSRKGLSREQFAQVLLAQFPSVSQPEVAHRMFEVFDRNKDSYLDFDEFMLGISRMASGTIEDKVRFLFDVTNASNGRGHGGGVSSAAARQPQAKDAAQAAEASPPADEIADKASGDDEDGGKNLKRARNSQSSPVLGALSNNDENISVKLIDLVKLIQDTNHELLDCAQLVELIITMMDTDKNGMVDRAEFKRATKDIPTILDSFDECMRPSPEFARHSRLLADAVPSFNPSLIINTWKTLGPRRIKYKIVDWEGFLEFFEQIWEDQQVKFASGKNLTSASKDRGSASNLAAGASYSHLRNIFRQVVGSDETAGTSVDLRNIIIGIVLALTESTLMNRAAFSVTAAEKGDFYFALFDVDGSGQVDYHEFFEMLYSSQLDIQDAGWKAVETLRCLDLDGDGIITFKEFMKAIRNHREVLDCFGRILQVTDLPPEEGKADSSRGPEGATEGGDCKPADGKPGTATAPETVEDDPVAQQSDAPEPAAGEESDAALQETQPARAAEMKDGDQVSGEASNEARAEEAERTEEPDEEPRPEEPSQEPRTDDSSSLKQSATSASLTPRSLARSSLSKSVPTLPLNSVYRTRYVFKNSGEGGEEGRGPAGRQGTSKPGTLAHQGSSRKQAAAPPARGSGSGARQSLARKPVGSQSPPNRSKPAGGRLEPL